MCKKLFLVSACVIFLFSIGCKKEGVSLINAGLRDAPSDQKGKFNWVKGVNRGQVVKILEEQPEGDWMKVQLSDGETKGWINKTYIHKGKKKIIEFTDATRLYDQPDVDSKVRSNLAAGTKAIVLKEKDQWYNVNISFGVDGWVKGGTFKEGSENTGKSLLEVNIAGIGKCSVEVSSNLPDSEGYTFGPANLFDRNAETTWQVGNGGLGEWVEITFPQPVSMSAAMINGFARVDSKFSQFGADGDLYQLNNRVKNLKVEYWDAQEKLQGSTLSFEDQLRDYQDAGTYQNVSRIRFIINGVYKGLKWNDTALAEIKIEKQ